MQTALKVLKTLSVDFAGWLFRFSVGLAVILFTGLCLILFIVGIDTVFGEDAKRYLVLAILVLLGVTVLTEASKDLVKYIKVLYNEAKEEEKEGEEYE